MTELLGACIALTGLAVTLLGVLLKYVTDSAAHRAVTDTRLAELERKAGRHDSYIAELKVAEGEGRGHRAALSSIHEEE